MFDPLDMIVSYQILRLIRIPAPVTRYSHLEKRDGTECVK